MANELKHVSTALAAGKAIAQTDWEDVDIHQFNSQATGDIMYASSPTQLSRLGIGATNTFLQVVGGIPAWVAAPTLAGNLKTGAFYLVVGASGGAGVIGQVDDTGFIYLKGGGTLGIGTLFQVTGVGNAATGGFYLYTPNAAGTGNTLRLLMTGKLAQATATWSAVDHIFGTGYLQFTERAAPGAGAANTARIYAVVDGGTLTDLAAVFQDGTVDIFAQETTPLDSPIFREPDKTEVKMVMLKPHPGIIQFAFKYPDGKTHVFKELQYHNEDKIKANIGSKDVLPPDWEVETTVKMKRRLAMFEQEAFEQEKKNKKALLETTSVKEEN